MQKTELARLLGVSRETVHRLVRRGMPTDSLETAVAWRAANLDGYKADQRRQDYRQHGRREK